MNQRIETDKTANAPEVFANGIIESDEAAKRAKALHNLDNPNIATINFLQQRGKLGQKVQ
jgi:hypothetical protein